MHIEIRNLSKTYPNGTQALKNVNLDIPMGMFGLLGPNGAGKSSLMRTIATLQEADTGTIHMADIDVLHDKEIMRTRLGYLPQYFGVYPGVSAARLLDHMATLKGITDKKQRQETVDYLLRQVNLYDNRHKAVSGFSGGMRQRFGIAQALLGKPGVIIVDEPTAGLDPAERVRFLNLLSEISTQAAIILSTHIVEDVSDLCTQMAIIAAGAVVLTGEPQALIDSLSGKVWQTTIERHDLQEFEQQYRVVSTRFFTGKIVVKVLSDEQPDHVQTVGGRAPGDGLAFQPAAPGLQDVYFCALKGWLSPDGVQSAVAA